MIPPSMYHLMTKAALQCVEEMALAEESLRYEDAEIVCEGLECWLGQRRVARRTLQVLIRLVLVSRQSNEGECERYALNEDGRAMAADENYEPRIIALMRGAVK